MCVYVCVLLVEICNSSYATKKQPTAGFVTSTSGLHLGDGMEANIQVPMKLSSCYTFKELLNFQGLYLTAPPNSPHKKWSIFYSVTLNLRRK